MAGWTSESGAEALASAYVNNRRNRGVHHRKEDLQAFLARRCPGTSEIEFLLGPGMSRYTDDELARIAGWWEQRLHRPVTRVLDAGCGPGATTLALARRYPSAHVFGVDVEAAAIRLGRHLAREEPRCTLQEVPLEQFAPKEPFDVIQCRAVLEHVFDPRSVLHRLVGWLRPGGVAYVETPNYLYPWEPHVRVPMFPRGPKSLVKAQCRLLGRDPDFVDHLNFDCDPRTLARWGREGQHPVEVVDLMAQKVQQMFSPDGDLPVVARRAAVVSAMRRLPALGRFGRRALIRLPMTPSVILLLIRH